MQERRPIVTPISHVPVIHPVLFSDDASGTFNYVISADGADYTADYNTSVAYVGTKGIYLKTRSTGATAGDKCTISKYLPLPPTKLLRFQAFFGETVVTRYPYFYVFLYYYDGTNLHGPEIFFDGSSGDVKYAAAFRSSYTDTALNYPLVKNAWNYLDLSVNLDTGKFHTLRVNNSIKDMSSIDIPTSASAVAPHLRLYMEVECPDNNYHTISIDQILVTAENP